MYVDVDAQQFLTLIQGDPDGFFRRNAVYWICAPSSVSAPTLSNFTVRRHDIQVEYYSPGKYGLFGGWNADGHSYQIVEDGSGAAQGCFLPWNEDFGYSIVLGGQAQFFINAMMDGCSFGCVAGPNGTVKVAHHNIQDAAGGTDHQAMTGTLSAFGYQHTFQRNDYRNLGNGQGLGFVTGVRVGGAWRIYGQGVYTAHGRDRIAFCRRLQ
ncbi:hypothetical protein [Azospirillum picis]|uniref:Uncharacterized protein n=1 Tax=Azospirillum picis TaxID=488438 RepID=A0ABU0MPM9_9PROT|nr:hypothetical protein [Azospirillum picis]MBP2301447.1 hypothetical protein [Azospirillum picis]MDQ0535279.1 hypothetical protein [Azospirillum picis]